jgi:flagellar hook-associated protein 3 FlgL
MRITKGIMISNLVNSLNRRMWSLDELERQVTSGKRVNYASDDPAAAGMILELRSRIRSNGQFQENAQSAIDWLTTTDTALQQMNDLLTEARADALEGSNGSLTQEQMMALAANVDGYLENFLSLANTDFNGKALFAGTNTTGQAFIATRDPITDQITSVAPNPQSTYGAIYRQVGNASIQININGEEVFQPDGAGGPQDVFQALIELRDALDDGDPEAVGQCLDAIDLVQSNVADANAQVGSQVNRLTAMQDMLLVKNTNLTSQLSDHEDVDMVEAMSRLALEQNAYQIALNVSGMIMQQATLADFIV